MKTTLRLYGTPPKTDGAVRTALVGEPGRKYLPLLMMDGGELSVKKVPIEEARYMTTIGSPRPKHVKIFRRYGQKFGISSTARQFLRSMEM